MDPRIARPLSVALVALGVVAAGAACKSAEGQETKKAAAAEPLDAEGAAPPPPAGREVAIFAGGCFWCMEPPFEKLDGVDEVYSGFVGGQEPRPAYKDVAYGRTGHTEAVRVIYDPKKITYEALLEVFWKNHDPTDAGGQFVDRGAQYRPGIFYVNEAQRVAAEKSKAALAQSKRFGDEPIVDEITAAGPFWLAEEYHQDFYEKSTDHYKRYRRGSGRDQFIEKHWGDGAKM